jgi:UDP-glucose 4-epimerase
MRKLMTVAAAVAALAVPSAAMAAPTGEPGEPTCEAAVISYAVQVGTGRREAAEVFFGDYPQAVQTAERALQGFCNPAG